MKLTDIYLTAIIGASFLLFASLDHNPLSPTTGYIAAVLIVLFAGFNKELKKD